MNLKVSVIIVVKNRERLIGKCLQSLMEVDYPDYEVIVVDDHSIDNTTGTVRTFPVKLLKSNGAGIGAGKNTGIRDASGEIIAFTDSDCLVAKDWLSQMVKHHVQYPDVMGVGGIIKNPIPKNFFARFGQKLCFDPPLPQQGFVKTIGGNNVSYKRDVFDIVGLFDERFITGEDPDMCWRLLHKGMKILYSPSIEIHHIHRSTFAGFLKQQFWYGQGNLQLCQKYGVPSTPLPPYDDKNILKYIINLRTKDETSFIPLFISGLLSYKLGMLYQRLNHNGDTARKI